MPSSTTAGTTTSTTVQYEKTLHLQTKRVQVTTQVQNEFTDIQISLAAVIEELKAQHIVALDKISARLGSAKTVFESYSFELQQYFEHVQATSDKFVEEKEQSMKEWRSHEIDLRRENQIEIQRLLREIAKAKQELKIAIV